MWLVASNGHVYDVLIYSGVMGAGIGIGYAALGTLAVQHVPMSQSGIASGINTLVRTVGGSISGAVTASLLTSHVIEGTAVPSLDGYELSFAVVAVGGAVAAAVALVHGLAFKHDRAHERPLSDMDTSPPAELAAVAGDYGDVPSRH